MGIPTTFNRMGIDKRGGGLPTDYIAYISCSSYAQTAETGQTLDYSNLGSTYFLTYGNIPCVDMTRSTYQCIRLTEPTINQGPTLPRSYSVWLATTYFNNNMRGIAIGQSANGKELCSPNNAGYTKELCAGGHSHDFRTGVFITEGVWHHYVQNYFADGTLELWLDGVKIYNGNTFQFDINNIVLSIGCPTNYTSSYFRGYAAAARLWNRALTEDEIKLLAQEFTPWYTITASDLTFSLYQKSETYGISYTSPMTPTFEIIEGELPSTISFNTSTGKFTGKGPTDADYTYNLKVRISAEKSDPVIVNVTIHTYKTARISMSNQSFSFVSNKAESKTISYTSDETCTFTLESGELPAGMTRSSNVFYSHADNTSAETKQVVIRATSAHNQTGVAATMTINMQMNAIVCDNQTLKFYTAQGVKSKAVAYSGRLNRVSDAVFAMTGTLPAGVTFDATTGTFTSDGTQTADETTSVSVTVSSSNGTSTSATATITLEVHEGAAPIPDDYTFYNSFSTAANIITPELGNTFSIGGNQPEFTVEDGMPCMHMSGGGTYQTGVNYFNASNTVITMSCWAKLEGLSSTTGNTTFIPMSTGKWNSGHAFEINIYKNNNQWYLWLNNFNYAYPSSTCPWPSGWHHICAVQDGVQGHPSEIYLDGVHVLSIINPYGPFIDLNLGFGSNFSYDNAFGRDGYTYGWVAAARIYSRVLTDDEIAALAAEFTPTT